MITRLEIENFKAIKHLAIDLDPLTVLVGPNDSGKSTILQALELLTRSMDRPVGEAGSPSSFAEQLTSLPGDRPRPIRIAVWGVSDGGVEYSCSVELDAGGQVLREIRREPPGHEAGWPELSFFVAALEPKKLAAPCRPDAAFQSDGLGLAALVDRIFSDRSARDAYEGALRSFSSHVTNVATREDARDGQLKEVVFGLRNATVVPAREISSGLLIAAGYLAVRHLPARRFLIEEPENGLHPHAMLPMVDVLRQLADDGRQVVMTTHSPVLLSYLAPENIRIVTRTGAEGVKVTPALESKVFNEVKQKVDFGELWYSVGDDALAVTCS